MKGTRKPSREEFREKVLEFLKKAEPAFESYPDEEEFTQIRRYINFRKEEEYAKIISGLNKEIEKRYDRYVDYG